MSLNDEKKVKATEEQEAVEIPENNEQPANEEKADESCESKKLKEQYDSLNDKFLRTLAEYDNFRKRSQRESD